MSTEVTETIVPDSIEPIVGYRAWKVQFCDDGWVLRSIAINYLWKPGERVTAACIPPHNYGWRTHDSPSTETDIQCPCGIWALNRMILVPRTHVLGTVFLWGKVVPATKGWRAQYAYPKELWFDPDNNPWPFIWEGAPAPAEMIAKDLERYGVPVHPRRYRGKQDEQEEQDAGTGRGSQAGGT